MKNLLVIIDMVNGFINFGSLADKKIDKITPNIIKLVEKTKKKGYKILAFKDCHEIDDEEFKSFPAHCIKGSKECELIPQLKEIQNMFDYIIDKNTTNGFITKKFQNLINCNNFNNVFVCGCCTDICVNNFVKSYLDYININKLSTKIYVVENACYTFDGKNHNAEYYHNKSLEDMHKCGAKIVKLKELENNYEKIN